jgi:uncharacterized protein (TIGR03435 family)
MKTTVLSLLTLATVVCLAQPPAPAPTFEVASVRLAVSPGISPTQRTSNSLAIHGLSLRDCIQTAWQLPEAQVSGPAWLGDVRLEIAAKASGPVDEKQLSLMLRGLLTERFGLKTHETRETATYALTVTKSGVKFAESTSDGAPAIKNAPGDKKSFEHFGMADFVVLLTRMLNRPVIDATGLKGHYDLHLDLTPYAPVANADGNPSAPFDPVTMMITALQEQMGLKVEARRDTVDFLTVDHAERTPTEN